MGSCQHVYMVNQLTDGTYYLVCVQGKGCTKGFGVDTWKEAKKYPITGRTY